MPKPQIITGIDIGTSKVAVTAGQIQEGLVSIVATSLKSNSGMRKGMVVDLEEVISSISAALEDAERQTGTPISQAFAGISGAHISVSDSKGVIAVSRADGEITDSDVERVIEAARAVALPPNREILHVIPRSYAVDGQEGIKDPISMNGIRLEVETHVIGGATFAIKNLTKCVIQAGLEIDGLIFSPLATSRALLSKKQKEAGVMLVDLGAGTTSFVAFEEGDLIGLGVIPIGSAHLTNDLAIGLRTSLDTAEKIKINAGTILTGEIRETETVDLSQYNPEEEQKIPKRYIAQILEARMQEILSLLKDELRKWGKDGMLPSGVVFTGGGSKLHGIVELAKENLHLPSQIGVPILEISGAVDKLEDPRYATSVGLLLWGLDNQQEGTPLKLGNLKLGGIVDKTKNFFKQFLP